MSVHEAGRTGDQLVLRKWLDTEGDVDRRDDHDFTVLHWAARKGQTEVVRLLLEHGADPQAVNCAGDTPLHYGAAGELVEVVQRLLDAGADCNIANDHGNVPLHYACYWRRKDIAELLVSRGASISIANKYGKTPLIKSGPLAPRLKELALQNGQSLTVSQASIRDVQEAAGVAKAKFMASAGVEWYVKPKTINCEELLASPSHLFEVYGGQWSNNQVAIKKPIQQEILPADIATLKDEVNSLRKLYHANILPILGGCIEPPDVCIFTELQSMGSLYRIIHDPNFSMDQRQAIKFALETCRALVYLHSNQICHYNLKTSNLFVGEDLSIRMAEFGMTTIFNSSINQDVLYEPQWCSPECLKDRVTPQTDFKPSDVYSFGVVLYEIITRQVPFEGLNVMQMGLKIILENARPEIPDFVPKHLSQLMQLCWQEEISRRPRIDQILPILEKC